MMKVLVTGGAGYIGTLLIQKLSEVKEIEEIVVYDNLSAGNYGLFFQLHSIKNSNIRLIQGDILDSRKIAKSLEGIDIVIHLAAKVTTPFSERGADYFEQVNHWGTAELVYAIEKSNVKRVIYMSSASVYGSQIEAVNLETIASPNTAYGFSKLRGEAHIERLKTDIDTIIIRCSNTFGYSPSMRLDSVVNKFLFKAQHKQIINVNGDGNQYRAFVTIEKVVETLQKFTISKDNGFQKMILSERNLTINDIIFHLKVLYPQLELIYVNQHLQLRNQFIEGAEALKSQEINEEFLTELVVFKEHFSF